MKCKKIISIVLCCALFFSMTPCNAYAASDVIDYGMEQNITDSSVAEDESISTPSDADDEDSEESQTSDTPTSDVDETDSEESQTPESSESDADVDETDNEESQLPETSSSDMDTENTDASSEDEELGINGISNNDATELMELSSKMLETGNTYSMVDDTLGVIDSPDASAVRITNAEELYAIRNDMYGSYVLMNDIDLSGYENWAPIGTTLSSAFHGKFDGQGHSITGLYTEESFNSGSLIGISYTVGLFGVCDGAEIKNVRVTDGNVSITTTSGYRYENAAITSDYSVYAGILVGYACNDTVIYNCSASGSVLAKAYEEGYSAAIAGGLVGYMDSGIISYSYSGCTVNAYNENVVEAYDAYAGGLVGAIENNVIIDRTYNGGGIIAQTLDYGNAYAGGLSGAAHSGSYEITNSYNAGQVIGQTGNMFCDDAYAGGLVGSFSGSIDSTYNSGTVSAKVVDPYSIGGGKAYAGGICGISSTSSTIKNSAIVQASVAATSSSSKYQYRISYQGNKTNNITIDSATTGSTNDADSIQTESYMKTSEPYISILGWDFNTIWRMVQGHDFPLLKPEDANSNEYADKYIAQHLSFINGGTYDGILSDERWAQIYWSEENTLASNTGEKLYHIVDTLVDLSQLKFGFLFEDNNPYKVIVADYVSNQASADWVEESYGLKTPEYLKKTQESVKKFVEANWNDAWGELSDEDIFWLFHYKDRPSEEWINVDFEKHLAEIVKDTKDQGETLGTLLNIPYEVFNAVLDSKEWLDGAAEYVYDIVNYSSSVNACVQTSEEFKTVLEKMCDNLPESTSEERKNKEQLQKALESYISLCSSDTMLLDLWENYLSEPTSNLGKEIIEKAFESRVKEWVEGAFSETAQQWLKTVGWAADKTWKFCDYLTKNGELVHCREILRANAYFENTMYNTLKSIESDFKIDQTLANAELFDTAYKFFKETELYSMETCIAYCDTYQTSWAQAIKHVSNTFMNSFIDEVHIHKLYLYRAYCHGKTYNLGGKVITVACPTDVFVYDEEGNVVASVENNVVTKSGSEALVYTADAVKLIFVPLDQAYTVKVSATDSGSMSYSVSEYDENLNNVQSVVYSNVTIEEGQSFTGSVGDSLNEEPESYNLKGDDNTIIDSYELYDKETNIPVTSIELSSETEAIRVGETLSVSAKLTPADAAIQSVVWSSSNPEIAEISEKGVITAKAEGEATIRVQSLYGGINAQLPITVIGKDEDLFITKHPKSAIYNLGDQATALSVSYFSVDEIVPTYQWYVSETEETADARKIQDATKSTYVPATDEESVKYYFVELTFGDKMLKSRTAKVVVEGNQIIASGECESGLIWEVNDKYYLTLSGTGSLSGFSVESDAPWHEYRNSIVAVIVKNGVSSIGKNAFVDMPGLLKVHIPNSVTNIVEEAFAGCTSLEEISIPFIGSSRDAAGTSDAVLGHLFGTSSSGVLQCYMQSGNSLSGYKYAIPNSLRKVSITDAKTIPFGAFYNCANLTSVELNEGITEIQGYSFRNCTGLTEMTIPKSVQSVAEYTLDGCNNIETLTVPFVGANREVNGTYEGALGYIFGRCSKGDNNCVLQYTILEGTSLSGYYYGIPDALKTVIVTDATQLPIGSFSNLKNVMSLTLNSGITEIGAYAFYNVTGLKDIYYLDWESEWNKITIGNQNTVLNDVTIHFLGPETTNSVDITWGALEYTYSDGIWNTSTHKYEDGGWTVNAEDGDVISVTNKGDKEVTISIDYHTERSDIAGIFDTEPIAMLNVGELKKWVLQLSGKPNEDLNNAVIGQVSVTIGGD